MNPILKLIGEAEDIWPDYDSSQDVTDWNVSDDEMFGEVWERGIENVPKSYIDRIAADPHKACMLAIEVIGGPFPQGEPAIATDAQESYYYATGVLEDRFLLGEPAIRNSDYWNLYRDHFKLHEPNP